MTAFPFEIGSYTGPGLGKLAEESGELIQVIGKLIATGGQAAHWDGTDLDRRLEDEIADVLAAASFVMSHNELDVRRIDARRREKLELFARWRAEVTSV